MSRVSWSKEFDSTPLCQYSFHYYVKYVDLVKQEYWMQCKFCGETK